MKKVSIALLAGMTGAFIGGYWKKIYYNISRLEDPAVNRLNSYYDTLNGWLCFRQQGKKMEDYLLQFGYKKIAIYALGAIGVRLYYELKDTNIQVAYAIDQNTDTHIEDLKVVSKKDKLENVDAVIVSIGFAYENIIKELGQKIDCPILSLQKLVYEIALSEEGVY